MEVNPLRKACLAREMLRFSDEVMFTLQFFKLAHAEKHKDGEGKNKIKGGFYCFFPPFLCEVAIFLMVFFRNCLSRTDRGKLEIGALKRHRQAQKSGLHYHIYYRRYFVARCSRAMRMGLCRVLPGSICVAGDDNPAFSFPSVRPLLFGF